VCLKKNLEKKSGKKIIHNEDASVHGACTEARSDSQSFSVKICLDSKTQEELSLAT